MEKIDFKKFGLSLKDIRKAMGVSQKTVALHTGIHIDTLRRIETNKVKLKLETLEILSFYYQIDLLKVLLDSRSVD